MPNTDLFEESQVVEAFMISSQLGRVILSGSSAGADEMSTSPDQDGSYGPIDGLLEEIAARADGESGCEAIDGRDVNRRLI